ncbi:oocyte zinc finger protein XlCOF6-like [Echeneis naucrates]|uniref:oocyte zinc finger protein XlCOF6-like n=1 Tax=Echeneis naucrates TaxID=173247 RepID=UPI0011134576|nr:oocyte zinc finger protein XlCOF6-like [Echeneis naucrates]
MFSMETVERQTAAVLKGLLEAALAELGALLDRYWADGSAAAKTEDRGVCPPEQRHFSTTITNQFALLMKGWTKGAVEKILMILKASMCEAQDGPTAEQRVGLNNKTKQTGQGPTAGRGARPRKQSTKRKKKIEAVPEITKDGHLYFEEDQRTKEITAAAAESERADVATHRQDNSGALSEPEVLLTTASDVSMKDVIQEGVASTATSDTKKKNMMPFKCPSCDKAFALKCLMDRHYLTHSKPHLCSECGKRFSGLRGLIAHSRRHTGEKLYKCSDCGTQFAYKYTFERHMRQHILKKPNTHMCTLCENQFAGILALQRHRCCALKKTFVCSLCPETFDSRKSLADHENLHSGDRDFVCEMCGESFFSSSSLATHRVTHIQRENCCDVLGLGCSDLSVLKNHLSKHTGEKLFTCEVCGKGCSHQSALKHHMLTHTGERPYVCETCGKRCGHASALQNHMRIHTGKKPGQQPVCNVCGKKFSCMVNLKYHMSIHTGEKPYSCDHCDKKFSNPSNLKLHRRIHSGEKMYGCNICSRRFTQSSSLKLHRRIHTGEKTYRCLVCGKEFIHSSDLRKHQRGHLLEELGGQSEKHQ